MVGPELSAATIEISCEEITSPPRPSLRLPTEFLRRLPPELARFGSNGVRPAPARVGGGRSRAERPTEPIRVFRPTNGAEAHH